MKFPYLCIPNKYLSCTYSRWPKGFTTLRVSADHYTCSLHIDINLLPCFPTSIFAPHGPHYLLHLFKKTFFSFSQIAVTTRRCCCPTALEIRGPKQMPKVICSSVCARATGEGSGSVSDMLHFTPPDWVRNDTISLLLPVWGEKNIYQRQLL